MFPVSLTWNIWWFQKPEELKEESVPDGEQKGLFHQIINRKLREQITFQQMLKLLKKAKTYLD